MNDPTRVVSLVSGVRVVFLIAALFLISGTSQTIASAATAPFHAVTFIENDSPSDQVFSSLTANTTTNLTAFASLNPTFSNPGHTFVDWNTAADGSGTSYADGAPYGFSAPIELFAIWTTASSETSYDPNGGVGVISSTSVTTGGSINLPTGNAFSRSGYVFHDWNTSSDGSGVSYASGANFVVNSNVTLYAQWTAVKIDVVSFRANGASGSQASLQGDDGTRVTLPGQAGFIKPGFRLVRWNTMADGKGTSFAIAQILTLTKSLTLYAQWNGHRPPVLVSAIGAFAKNSSTLNPVLKRQVQRLATTIKAHRYRLVTLYGYSASTGLVSFDLSLSRSRAASVARQLRSDLVRLHVTGVRITSAGEGSIAGQSTATFSRVEVFVS